MAGNVKICNLDLIAPITKRELVIGDKTYAVEPLSVMKFIEFAKARQGLSATTSIEDAVKVMMELIMGAIPTMEREVLEALPIIQLQTVLAFVADEIPDEALTPKVAGEAVKVDEKASEGEDTSGK